MKTLQELLLPYVYDANGKYNFRIILPPFLLTSVNEVTKKCQGDLKNKLYWIFNNLTDYPICNGCNKSIVKSISSFNDILVNQKHCNSTCRFKDKIAQSKVIEDFKLKYGHTNPGLIKAFIDKGLQTNLLRYGSKKPGHIEKGKATCIKRYGVSNVMQDFNIFQKALGARYKLKTFILPSGAVLKYQGYENVALELLLNIGINETDISVNRKTIPKIFYLNDKNKQSRYYPDIWIKSKNLLIEVKSEYTFNLNKNQALNKQDACKKLGYNHIIVICTKKKIINII